MAGFEVSTEDGLNFVPDVLIRRTLDRVTDVLPIEIKLVTKPACSQAVATAIGQAIAYRVRYPRSIAFIGVRHGVTDGNHPLINETSHTPSEETLRSRLEADGVSLIFREVSAPAV